MPARCPSARGGPRVFAQRPLPSMMMAMCRGSRVRAISSTSARSDEPFPASVSRSITKASLGGFGPVSHAEERQALRRRLRREHPAVPRIQQFRSPRDRNPAAGRVGEDAGDGPRHPAQEAFAAKERPQLDAGFLDPDELERADARFDPRGKTPNGEYGEIAPAG